MNGVYFTSTKLAKMGKKGVYKPDSDGYYTIVLGALNCYNSAGHFYTADGATHLFEKSSGFMRRVQNRCVKAECGHPEFVAGMTEDQYVNRILTIVEKNVVAHIADIWLDFDFGKNHPEYDNRDLIAIMGKVKPSGPHAAWFKECLDNGVEDVCFSIRALTRDYYNRGTRIRVLDQIVTFDYVTEPGISIARKFNSPAMEQLSDKVMTDSDTFIKASTLRKIVERASDVAIESNIAIVKEALERIEISHKTKFKTSGFKNW